MSRIACGVVAGPLYLVAGYAQAFTREGFDLSRHPFSMLSLGSLGWIQIANFIVSGALFLVAATGMAKHTKWGPVISSGRLQLSATNCIRPVGVWPSYSKKFCNRVLFLY